MKNRILTEFTIRIIINFYLKSGKSTLFRKQNLNYKFKNTRNKINLTLVELQFRCYYNTNPFIAVTNIFVETLKIYNNLKVKRKLIGEGGSISPTLWEYVSYLFNRYVKVND